MQFLQKRKLRSMFNMEKLFQQTSIIKEALIIFTLFTILLLTAFGCKKANDNQTGNTGNTGKDETTDCDASASTVCILDLSVKTSFSGTIAVGDTGDWIKVDLMANTTYQITVSSPARGGAQLQLSVYANSSLNTPLIDTDELYTATASQSHYIAIESNTPPPKDYTLNVIPAPDPIDSSMACNRMDNEADCDGDGRANPMDAFPHNACATTDTDTDGFPNNVIAPAEGQSCDRAEAETLVGELNAKDMADTQIPGCSIGTFVMACADIDDDGDGSNDSDDVDDDNDGLIEIYFLEDLNNSRNNLMGTSYTTGGGISSSMGCGNGGTITACNGYELARSLNFSDPSSYRNATAKMDEWTTGTGWTPIGNNSTDNSNTRFNAIFEGNGNTIANLFIERNDSNYIGLFGSIGEGGEVRNMGLASANSSYVGSSGNDTYVGILVGFLVGTIESANVSGIVSGGIVSDLSGELSYVGGMVGRNFRGTITAGYATVIANGGGGDDDRVGGLVGDNLGTIMLSYADSNANGGGGNRDRVGGLVGANNNDPFAGGGIGTITSSYATGIADGGEGDSDRVGGLAGDNLGTITSSHANVSINGGDGGDRVGGLVGENSDPVAMIISSYATGTVRGGGIGQNAVGGLVGFNRHGRITLSSAEGTANGGDGNGDRVGGLVGQNGFSDNGVITSSHATGAAYGGGGDDDHVGGLVGENKSGTIISSYANSNASGGGGNTNRVGGLVGLNGDTIISSYATGAAYGGEGSNDTVGGLVGQNDDTIISSYAIGVVNGSGGTTDRVGGLVGFNFNTIISSYAIGAVNGGEGDGDHVGGLVGSMGGSQDGTINASYAIGAVNGGGGTGNLVGQLVGQNIASNLIITLSYGFGIVMGGDSTSAINRSSDAALATGAGAVTNAMQLALTNSQWPEMAWDFASGKNPALRWVTSYNTSTMVYTCVGMLLPTGQMCMNGIIPGQGRTP